MAFVGDKGGWPRSMTGIGNGVPGLASQRAWRRRLQPAMSACAIVGAVALGGCSHPVNCNGGDFGGGCYPGPEPAPQASVAMPGPAAVPAAAAPSSYAPTTSARGEPSAFEQVDDRQCRSYGLKFGTWDYAQCRIELSAQHRGLDPHTGEAPAAPGNR